MALISNADLERLRATFEDELEGEVALKVLVGEAGPHNDLARELMKEIASLSSKTSLELVEASVEAPAIVLGGRLKGALRFVGLPLGYELSVFVDAIKFSSTGRTNLAKKSRERIAGLRSARQVRVFTTPD